MRILLLSGSNTNRLKAYGDYYRVGPRLQPYNIMQLASVLETDGHQLKVIDTEIEPLPMEAISERIRSFAPRIIGVSVYTIHLGYVKKLLGYLKSRFPDMVFVAGGPHVTLYPRTLVKQGLADYCFHGESEMAFKEFARRMESGESVSGISNIVFRSGGDIAVNPAAPLMEDLDRLPFPAFHLIEGRLKKYHPQPLTYRRRPMTILVTSRGCVYDCSFCPSSGIWAGRRWRSQTAEYVFSLISHLYENYGIREICFNENSFAVSRQRVMEICDRLTASGIDISWTANINLRTLDEETAYMMRQAGCWLVSAGIESGDDRILKKINKPATVKEIAEKVEMLNRVGIKVRGYFMIGNPGETETDIMKTLEFSRDLPLYSANFSLFVPVPGSVFFNDIYGSGAEHAAGELSNYAEVGSNIRYRSETLEDTGLASLQKKAFMGFFLRLKMLILYLKTMRSFEDMRRYWKMVWAATVLTVRNLERSLIG